MTRLRVGVDTGGTFTDLVLLDRDGTLQVHKLLSTPHDPAQAVLAGLAQLLSQRDAVPDIIHGSTVATNALLEGKGGRLAFVTTAGFEDLLWLRRQTRPALYELEPVLPMLPLEQGDCLGLAERIDPVGRIELGLAAAELEQLAAWFAARAGRPDPPTAVAICLLHSYANPAHEQRIAGRLRAQFPQLHITVSSELLPEFREYERAATCLVNAACAAPMLGYLGRLEASLAASASLSIMGSAGGSLPLAEVRAVPARTVLSGPAGGVIGALHCAQAAGVARFLSYDIGGTSTDVALCDGAVSLTQQSEIAGLPLKLPLLDIHTVGAGGGSVAWLDAGGALRVGPQSLGSNPGPACYGRQTGARRAAVTDAHVVLGHFPGTSRLAGELTLDRAAAREAIAVLATALGLSVEAAAQGVLQVAAAEVSRALRRMSVERGQDPRSFTLLPFGGAGGLHAAELARQLGMTRILLPPHPGLLSALGMLVAGPVYHFSQTLLLPLAADGGLPVGWQQAAERMRGQAAAALAAARVPPEQRSYSYSADLRYRGQSHEINVPLEGASAHFTAAHLRLYGYNPADTQVEVVALRLAARGPQPALPLPLLQRRGRVFNLSGLPVSPVWNDGAWQDWPVAQRAELLAGDELPGPLLLAEYSSTTLVPAGWRGKVLASGGILVEKVPAEVPTIDAGAGGKALAPTAARGQSQAPDQANSDPVALSIFRHLYSAIAEEMGARLMRSAYSPNIKERRDFSCALFTAQGEMLAQAAHIPVHLGSMPLSVAAILAAFPPTQMLPDETFVVNDPFHGGTHLPDITVVAPVFLPGQARPQFFVANRAHHADIGGISPGSMPLSRSIDEEGIRLLPQRLDTACVERICSASRTPQERRGDLQAQLAALQLGQTRLAELCQAHGAATCTGYATALLDYSERCMRQALALVGEFGSRPGATGWPAAAFADYLDGDGLGATDIALHCVVTLEVDGATVDLRGCDPQVNGPFNAVRAICLSAVLYCFRCLAQRVLPGTDIPENAGLLRPIRVLTTPGTVVDALPPAAVAGGNVETSQRLVDLLCGALAQLAPGLIPAASGGSMNNVTIGAEAGRASVPAKGSWAEISAPREAFAYYETLACGAGGGPQRAGASAIHTHMTNTLNTPVEALEHAYPLRLVAYRLRRGSGGAGLHPGGDGIIRRYRALAACRLTLLTERRRHRPWGLAGGGAGLPGVNTLYRADGQVVDLGGKASVELQPGDELELATPGGGGYGEAQS